MTDLKDKKSETDVRKKKGTPRPFPDMGIGRFPERLAGIMNGRSTRSFARDCDLSETVLRKYLKDDSSKPTIDRLGRIAWAGGVSVEWLLTGEGEPNRKQHKQFGKVAEQMPGIYGPNATDTDLVMVPRYDVQASAGHGAIVSSEQIVDYMAFKAEWVKREGLTPGQLALVETIGDSMEPAISAGDLLLVDLSRTAPADGIYILRQGEELLAKRVQAMFTGELYIRSDNEAYTAQIIPADRTNELQIIGRVVWAGRKM